jgi:hypothetical protein
MTPAERSEVARLCRVSGTAHAMKRLSDAGVSVVDAKSIALHLSVRPTECHRCQSKLAGGTEVICAKCSALNFDW